MSTTSDEMELRTALKSAPVNGTRPADPPADAADADVEESFDWEAAEMHPSTWRQFKGVWKYLAFSQARNYKFMCCQAFLPILLLGIQLLIARQFNFGLNDGSYKPDFLWQQGYTGQLVSDAPVYSLPGAHPVVEHCPLNASVWGNLQALSVSEALTGSGKKGIGSIITKQTPKIQPPGFATPQRGHLYTDDQPTFYACNLYDNGNLLNNQYVNLVLYDCGGNVIRTDACSVSTLPLTGPYVVFVTHKTDDFPGIDFQYTLSVVNDYNSDDPYNATHAIPLFYGAYEYGYRSQCMNPYSSRLYVPYSLPKNVKAGSAPRTNEGSGLLGDAARIATPGGIYFPTTLRIDEDTAADEEKLRELSDCPAGTFPPYGLDHYTAYQCAAMAWSYPVLDLDTLHISAEVWTSLAQQEDTYAIVGMTEHVSFTSSLIKAVTGETKILKPVLKLITDVGGGKVVFGCGLTYYILAFLSCTAPMLAYSLAMEAENGHRILMQMNGLRTLPYWLAHIGITTGTLIVVNLVFWVLSLSRPSTVCYGNFNVLSGFVVILLWAVSLSAMCVCVSVVVRSPLMATSLCFFVVLMGMTAGAVAGPALDYTSDYVPSYPFFLFLIPPVAFGRAVYLMNFRYNSAAFLLSNKLGDLNPRFELGRICVGMALSTVIYIVVARYLVDILPRKFGVQRSVFWPVYDFIEWVRKKTGQSVTETTESVRYRYGTMDTDEAGVDDDIVALSREAEAMYLRDPGEAAVLCHHLSKHYKRNNKSTLKAVDDLSLILHRGECFGLLGPNGAGKTTLVGILMRLFEATGGEAFIDGSRVFGVDRALARVGVCMQHDVVWDTLTVREHLLLFARIKGVDPAIERKYVHAIIAFVGLKKAANRTGGKLSGGMKRRLSFGIALVGNPVVMFLDEPSTGLDPDTRRNLWEVIQSTRSPRRCVVVTTHSMEEADVLCDRLGIMVHGKMSCIGTAQHLRAKFASGFAIHAVARHGCASRVKRAVTALIPSATLIREAGHAMTFRFPRADVSMAHVFSELKSRQREFGIRDWTVNQMSLEQVFVNVLSESMGGLGEAVAAGGGVDGDAGSSKRCCC